MRLTPHQKSLILAITRQLLGDGVEVRVYGSRLHDHRRGGDLDLLLRSRQRVSLLERAELKRALEDALQIPVDVLYCPTDTEQTPFQAIALAQSQPLEVAA